MKIGNTSLELGLILAPLAGFTDLAFRTLCAEQGAEYTVTEMISAKAVMMNNKKTFGLAKMSQVPTAIQLFGAEEEPVRYASELLSAPDMPWGSAAAIDINMGCPMHKIVSNGEGSALMRDPKCAEKVIKAAVKGSRVPVTVKIRAGWDKDSINAPEIAKIAEDCGAAAVAVHARTKEQLYSGKADHSVTRRVVEAVNIPVIANGDIKSAQDVLRLRDMGCSAFMIGRGAVGDPWIFARLASALRGEEYTEPTVRERMELAVRHLEMAVADKGEHIAVPEARKHLSAYISSFSGAAAVRAKINTLNSSRDITDMLRELADKQQ